MKTMYWRFRHYLLCCALGAGAMVSEVAGGAGSDREWLEQLNVSDSPIKGAARGLEVENERLYLLTDGTLAVFDVSDPASPIFLGFDRTSGMSMGLGVSDGRAYVVGYHEGLEVMDARNPESFFLPVIARHELTGAQSFSGVGIDGQRVFASGFATELFGFDITDPTALRVMATASVATGESIHFHATDIQVSEGHIFMAGGDDDWGAVKIYRDVEGEDPEFAGEFRMIELPNPATGVSRRIAVNGDVAYVADSGMGLCVLDVSDPTNPQLIRADGEPPRDLEQTAELLLVLTDGALMVLDVTDPANPVERGVLSMPGENWQLAISGRTAYVANRSPGLVLVDFSNPDQLVVLGEFEVTGYRALDAQSSGELVYVAGQGLQVIDASDPTAPEKVGSAEHGYSYYTVVVDGDRAAARWESFGIIHLYELGDDLRSPTLAGEVRENNVQGYDLAGSTLFIAAAGSGLRVHDVGNPSRPYLAGSWEEEGRSIHDVAVQDGLAVVGSHNPGLLFLDVSTRSAPVKVGSYNGLWDEGVDAFCLDGNRVYVAEPSAFTILDVSNPATPVTIGSTPLAGSPFSAVSAGRGFAVIAGWDSPVQVVDIRDPTEPVVVRTDLGVAGVVRFDVRDGLLHLARGDLGLALVNLELPAPRLSIARVSGNPDSIQVSWDAPAGLAFGMEGSHNLMDWFPLGRFTQDTLQDALQSIGEVEVGVPVFLRVAE